MRVIVDTSVWSLSLRRRNPVSSAETDALTELVADGRAVMLGAVGKRSFLAFAILNNLRGFRRHWMLFQTSLLRLPTMLKRQ